MVVIPGQQHLCVDVVRLERLRGAHQHDDPRVGDCVHNLFAVVLPAQDALFIAPDGGPFFLQQVGDVEHLLGIVSSITNKDLRLGPGADF